MKHLIKPTGEWENTHQSSSSSSSQSDENYFKSPDSFFSRIALKTQHVQHFEQLRKWILCEFLTLPSMSTHTQYLHKHWPWSLPQFIILFLSWQLKKFKVGNDDDDGWWLMVVGDGKRSYSKRHTYAHVSSVYI